MGRPVGGGVRAARRRRADARSRRDRIQPHLPGLHGVGRTAIAARRPLQASRRRPQRTGRGGRLGGGAGVARRGVRHHRGRAAAPQPILAQGGGRADRRAGGRLQHRHGLPGDGAGRRLQPAPPRTLSAAGARERRRPGRPAEQGRPGPGAARGDGRDHRAGVQRPGPRHQRRLRGWGWATCCRTWGWAGPARSWGRPARGSPR